MKKSTLAAVAIFAVLVVVVFATREEHVNVGVPKLTLPTFDAASVTALEVSAGDNSASLTLANGAWSVSAPDAGSPKFVADENQVKSALTQLAELRPGEFVTENAAKHAELEVDSAKGLEVKVSTGAAPVVDLVIGKAAKSGGAYFRLASSNAVFTTKANVGWALRKNVSAWRKKAITTAALADVTTVALQNGAEAYELSLGEGGAWALKSPAPQGFRFDPLAASRLAQALTSLTAQSFVDQDATADFASTHPTFTLTTKDGKAATVHFSATKRPDNTYAVRVDQDPQVYLVSSYTVEHLATSLEALRDTSLFTFASEKVTRVTVTTKGAKTVVAKDGTSWKLVEPKNAPAGVEFDPGQVGALLTRLKAMRAQKVASGLTEAKAGLAKAAPTVELQLEGESKPQTLTYGAEVDEAGAKLVYARGAADALVYLAPVSDRASFEAGVKLFNKPPPMPNPGAGHISGLEQLPPDVRAKLEAQLRQQGLGGMPPGAAVTH